MFDFQKIFKNKFKQEINIKLTMLQTVTYCIALLLFTMFTLKTKCVLCKNETELKTPNQVDVPLTGNLQHQFYKYK